MIEGTTHSPLSVSRDLDARGWLQGVTTFNLHLHMPHYALTTDDPKAAIVLGQQLIDLTRPPHWATEALNGKINSFVWNSSKRGTSRRRADCGLHAVQHAVRRG